MVNGRTFALGAIGGSCVSVQLALAERAVASTGTATEEASQSGIPLRTLAKETSAGGMILSDRWPSAGPPF